MTLPKHEVNTANRKKNKYGNNVQNLFTVYIFVLMIQYVKTEEGVDHYIVKYEGDELPFFVTPIDRDANEVSVSPGLMQLLQISTSFGNDFAKALYDLKIINS